MFTVPLATNRYVTVVSTGYAYDGGAHGRHFTVAVTYDLKRAKPVLLKDIFAEGSSWSDNLALRAIAKAGANPERPAALENARKVVSDPANWTLLAEGAQLTFPEYSIAPYADGEPVAVFTWEELRPYLKTEAPIPLR